MYHLARRLKAKAAADPSPRNAPLKRLNWQYSTHGIHDEPNVSESAEGNQWPRSYNSGELLESYQEAEERWHARRRAAGSTAAFIPRSISTRPISASRKIISATAGDSPGPTIAAFFTTAARRVPTASPGASARSWSGGTKRKREWTGLDIPDFDKNKPPDYRPRPDAKGMDAIAGDKPFILHPDGVGWLFVTSGLKDGPLPTHYEPLEIAVRQSALSRAHYQSCR